ncbi:cob(I)yrinic acid a,c-diamide adenosyltransferase [Terrilactibacillus sp. S3-3]|nr:cob(I)yrinic acid a,c-diamide adenosyltransferase [Terrilactibacillus sp. S3-3]
MFIRTEADVTRIYTRTGDSGTTSLIYGERVPKNHLRVQTYGTCDEVNAFIGLAVSHLCRSELAADPLITDLQKIQTVLFYAGAELATPKGKEVCWKLEQKHIVLLEKRIDKMQEVLPVLKQFILPGGGEAGAALHVARTVARRAERLAAALKDEVNPLVLIFLNRLSDFLFVAARTVNFKMGIPENVLHAEQYEK